LSTNSQQSATTCQLTLINLQLLVKLTLINLQLLINQLSLMNEVNIH